MPIFIDQLEAGPSMNIGGDNESAELKYRVNGTYIDTEVYGVVSGLAPTTYTSPSTERILYLQNIHLEHEAAQSWVATCSYGPREPKEAGDPPDFSFDISTDTTKITQSLATLGKYPTSGGSAAPDLKGAINWNGEEAEGVDIILPKCTLSYKVIVAAEDMTDEFQRNLSYAVGTTNNGTWKGYAAGELLVTGISGRYRYKEFDWELAFTIAVSKNKSGLTVGGISGIDKPGWAYLWVKYKKSVSGANKITVPEHVYVERVYDESDFGNLPL